MALKRVLVCDVCGADDAVEVTITIEDAVFKADLCTTHRAPLGDILTHARESRIRPRTGTGFEKVRPEHLIARLQQEEG